MRKVQHTGKVYDITMKSNPHTFFANDILVHNSCYFRILEAENLDQAEILQIVGSIYSNADKFNKA